MADFFTCFTVEEMELMVVLASCIWLRRNIFVFEDSFTPNIVVSSAIEAFQKYKLCNQQNQPDIEEVAPSSIQSGNPPPSGVVKVNWDATVNKKEGCIGVDIIARDLEGMFLGAKSMFCSFNEDPTVAEATAATHAVIFCKEVGSLM
jgi:hypothetical protein